jgi:putative ABC transport system permease protein
VFAVAVRMCRRRLGALLAVFCAVLGGAALVTGTGVLAETGLRGHLPAARLAGATVLVSAPQQVPQYQDLSVALPERATVPATLTDRLRHLPGVTAAAGDVSFPAAVLTRDGHPLTAGDPATAGHGWSSTTLLANAHLTGTAPSGSLPEVGLEAGIAKAAGVGVGDPVTVVADGKVGSYRVSAVVAAAGAGVLFDDRTVAALAGRDSGPRRGTVDLVGLRTAPGQAAAVAARIRTMAARGDLASGNGASDGAGNGESGAGAGLVVSTGAERGDVVLPGAAAARRLLVPLAGSMAGVVLMIVGFIIAGALAVSVAGQRRELALLRAVGATPRQVRRLAGAQATAVGLVALVPGVLLGVLLAVRMRGLLVGLGMLPDGLPLSVGPLPAVVAAVLLLGVVQVAARAAAWRTSRLPATEAVAESRSEPRVPSRLRTRIGLLLLALAAGASVVPLVIRSVAGAVATSTAGILAAVGLALAGPALVRAVSGVLARRLPARASAATWLAVANSNAYALRVAGAVSTLAMVVVFTLTYALTQTTVLAAGTTELAAGTHAQAVLTAPALGGVPGDVLTAARAVGAGRRAGRRHQRAVAVP